MHLRQDRPPNRRFPRRGESTKSNAMRSMKRKLHRLRDPASRRPTAAIPYRARGGTVSGDCSARCGVLPPDIHPSCARRISGQGYELRTARNRGPISGVTPPGLAPPRPSGSRTKVRRNRGRLARAWIVKTEARRDASQTGCGQPAAPEAYCGKYVAGRRGLHAPVSLDISSARSTSGGSSPG